MMKIFKKKEETSVVTNPITLAEAKAQSAMSMFESAIANLAEANQMLEARKAENAEKIEAIEKENSSVDSSIEKNAKALGKLKGFFE